MQQKETLQVDDDDDDDGSLLYAFSDLPSRREAVSLYKRSNNSVQVFRISTYEYNQSIQKVLLASSNNNQRCLISPLKLSASKEEQENSFVVMKLFFLSEQNASSSSSVTTESSLVESILREISAHLAISEKLRKSQEEGEGESNPDISKSIPALLAVSSTKLLDAVALHSNKNSSSSLFSSSSSSSSSSSLSSSSSSPSFWLAFEYVRAVPLQRIFVSGLIKKKLPRALVASIIAQAAIILANLHSKVRLVVRDLKLPNLLLNPTTGRLHLVDFGCCCFRAENNKMEEEQEGPKEKEEKKTSKSSSSFLSFLSSKNPIGTPHIRAPEMYRPKSNCSTTSSSSSSPSVCYFDAMSPSVDFYALGCALVELLTGEPAFGSFNYASPSAASSATSCTKTAEEEEQEEEKGIEEREKQHLEKLVLSETRNSSGKTFPREDKAATNLISRLLDPCDPSRRNITLLENSNSSYSSSLALFLQDSFFSLSVKNHIDSGDYENEEEIKQKFDVKNISTWDLEKWSQLALDVISSYDNVEDEIDLQLLGL